MTGRARAGGDEIATARLLLRRARTEDLDDLHAVFSHPDAMRYWGTPPHGARAQTADLLAATRRAVPPDGDDFVIEHGGRAIGKAGCWRVGEVGFILHPDAWGRGFAREALTAAIPHAFAALPMDRMTADVDPRNEASLGLLARLGFRRAGYAERTFCVAGEWSDSVYLELPRPRAADGVMP